MIIRPATVRDVPRIAALISPYAQRGKMLFRSHAELYETVRDFIVAEEPSSSPASSAPASITTPQVVGICALEIVWSDLAEVRSLVVDPQHQGKGIGRSLVLAVVEEARRLEIQRLFTLTYEQTFFEKLAFHVVEKSALPLKVWSVCVKCPKRDGCDEIAMVRHVLDRPPLEEENPDTQSHLRYEVPTPLTQLQTKSANPPPRP